MTLRLRPLVQTTQDGLDLPKDVRTDRWRDDYTRAFIAEAEIDGAVTPVATAHLWVSRVHATRWWLQVEVFSRFRGRRLGSRVAILVASERNDDRLLCTRGLLHSPAVDFALALGAVPYQRSPPGRVSTEGRHASGRTVPLDMVPAHEVARAWLETYRWVHESWSPVAHGSTEALRAELDHADLRLSRGWLDAAGSIRAAAFAFPDAVVPIVVAEARRRDEPDGTIRVTACLGDSLVALGDAGHPKADVDGHVTDPHLMPALRTLAARGRETVLLEWDPGGAVSSTIRP